MMPSEQPTNGHWIHLESPFRSIAALEELGGMDDAFTGEARGQTDEAEPVTEEDWYGEESDIDEALPHAREMWSPLETGEAALALEALAEINAEVAAEEEGSPAPPPGISPLAIPAHKRWDAQDRPKEWQGRVYGLVVHTTGSGLPAAAKDQGLYHTVHAINYYTRTHGCHYVNGWRGVDGGDLLQIANENELAHGVGVTNAKEPSKDQRRSIELGRFEQDLPPVLVRLWRARWPGYTDSMALLPGTRTANACYIHVECVPCVYHYNGNLITDTPPLREGLRFTQAQHDAVALLACDIARRNDWPADQRWHRSPRLLGHEDLTPISRHDRNGGWDPGHLRERPYFDWEHVYQTIERIASGRADSARLPAAASPGRAILAILGDLANRFAELVSAGQAALAVTLAYQRGVHDINKLTNLVFFARHKELGGRAIRPDERDLVKQWLAIRDSIVKPTVAALARKSVAAP
jgi:hypothetical protein